MPPCLKSRLFVRSHILEMNHEQVPEAGTGKLLERHIAVGRFTGDMEEHLCPVEICTEGLLLFLSPQGWNGPAQNCHSYSIQNTLN